VLLLCGSDKASQARNIASAKQLARLRGFALENRDFVIFWLAK
jgi:hypothetical protein